MRTKEQIQQEYFNVCAQAGDMQYRIETFQEELAKLNNKLHNLNQEVRKLEKEDAKADAEAVGESPVAEAPNAEAN